MKGKSIEMNQLLDKSVLVFGEDTRSFLTVIRSLHNAGMHVDVVTFSNTSVALKSNAIRQVFQFNHQSQTITQWTESVTQVLQENKYDLVIPCDERALFPLMDLKNQLSLNTVFAVPEESIIGPLFNKVETRQVAESCDIRVAKGKLLPFNDISFSNLESEFGLPCVLKPTQSYEQEELSSRNSVKIIRSEEDFKAVAKHSQNESFLIEEYFTGYGVGVSVLAKRGKIKAAFAHARVAEPESGGGSSYRKAIPVDPDMLFACEKFCLKLNYTGVGMFEFKYNATLKEWILIEINARFWGSLPLAVFAGVDFPKLYAQVLLGIKTADVLTYNLKAYARSLTSDIYDIKSEFDQLRSRSGNATALAQLGKRLLSFSRLITGNESIDSFTWQDQKPFWYEMYSLLEGKLTRLPLVKNRLKDTRLTTFDENLKRPVTKVLLVCYGNIMRSPFAEHLFNKKIAGTALQHLQVDSYGFHQVVGRHAKTECVEMAKNWDVKLSEHRSKQLMFNDVLNDDPLIVIFDLKNEYILQSFYPNCRYINLADLLPTQFGFNREIKDPYDADEAYLKHCYDLIDNGLNVLINRIR